MRPLQLLWLVVVAGIFGQGRGGGRLLDPPGRGTLWRVGIPSREDYDDHRLNCGGVEQQWGVWGGRCGTCGDDYGLSRPRPHDLGGDFGQGTITRNYTQGQVIESVVELTSSLQGGFILYICSEATSTDLQACLDQHPLPLAEAATKQHFVYRPQDGSHVARVSYLLPADLTCSHCVILWRYITGHSWGIAENGTECKGCGHQEEFRACADVSIHPSSEPISNEEESSDGKDDISSRRYFPIPVTGTLIPEKLAKTRLVEPLDEVINLMDQTITKNPHMGSSEALTSNVKGNSEALTRNVEGSSETLTNRVETTTYWNRSRLDETTIQPAELGTRLESNEIVYKITRMEDATNTAGHLNLSRTEPLKWQLHPVAIKRKEGLSKIEDIEVITTTELHVPVTGSRDVEETTTFDRPWAGREDSFSSEHTIVDSATTAEVTFTKMEEELSTSSSQSSSLIASPTLPASTISPTTTNMNLVAINNNTSLIEEFYQRELLLLQLMRQNSQQPEGLAGWLATATRAPASATIGNNSGGTMNIGWSILISLPITLLCFLVVFLLHRHLVKNRHRRLHKRSQEEGDDNNEDDNGDDEHSELYEYPRTVLSHGGSAPALYQSLSRQSGGNIKQVGDREHSPLQRTRDICDDGEDAATAFSHTYASVPDVVSTSLMLGSRGGKETSSLDSFSHVAGDDIQSVDDVENTVKSEMEEGSEMGSTTDGVARTGFVRNARGRYSLVSASNRRRWKSDDWENSEENLFSTLAMKLRRKQSRPEITEL